MNKGLLLFVLALSGCSTITTEPPKDFTKYAEIDVVVTNDAPEVTIENVAAYTGLSSKYFFTSLTQKEPKKVFLSPGTYLVRAGCYGDLYIRSYYGEPVSFTPELKVSVEGGKKYWLGCEHNDSSSSIYLDVQQ